MGGSRRWAAATALALSVGILPAEAAVARQSTSPEAPITVSYPAAPDQTRLVSPIGLNERGEVLAELPDRAGGATVVWRHGRVTPVGPEGVTLLFAAVLSERGEVVGHRAYRPFSWWRGRYVEAPTDDQIGLPVDVNERGQVLVWLSSPPKYGFDGIVVWDEGRLITPPAGVEVVGFADEPQPQGINNGGQVAIDIRVGSEIHAAVWQVGGGVADLGTLGGPDSQVSAINEAGDVVGTSLTGGGDEHAFLWRDGEMIDIGTLGGSQSHGDLINDRGHVAGTSSTANGERHAFLWRDGEMVDIGTFGGSGIDPGSAPIDLNNRDQVVGVADADPAGYRAFLWQDGRMTDLSALVGPQGAQPVDMNDRGQILGRAFDDDQTAVLWAVPSRR